jgi:GAF domain-containing protein
VNDVTKDKGNRYKRYDEPSNSELCVPIVDQDRLVGVINLESYRKGAFDERDKQMLEALADQVVIAIQSVKNREQLVKVRALADLGTVTSSLIHRINSEVGAIRVWAEDIYDVGDPYSEGKALRIRASAERILQKAQRMQVWIQQEDKLPINIAEFPI